MSHLDDLPNRSGEHDTQTAAEAAFVTAIESQEYFVIQGRDRHDYGTDYQLEARHGRAMTNLRVHVQVKGTTGAEDPAGVVRVEVSRRNLNYLLNQPHSFYVCFHLPSQRLLVRDARDVHREYEHRGPSWRQQRTITIKFTEVFDQQFQERLSALVVASGRSSRAWRLTWTASPPSTLPTIVRRSLPPLELPTDPSRAHEVLSELYDAGEDLLISNSFEQFHAVLGSRPGAMDLAYMAEINLGINDLPIDSDRVRSGIQVLEDAMERGEVHPGTLLYSQGNGWLALGEYERARETYHLALLQLSGPSLQKCAAQCTKNMGSALEALGSQDAARAFYERALELDPDLGEAHFALALWHRQHGDEPERALEHLDAVTPRRGSPIEFLRVRGWRMALLFQTGDTENAFREVRALLEHARHIDWVWPWCARQVANYGRFSPSSSKQAERFWAAYLEEHPGDVYAQHERLLCLWHLRSENVETGISLETFKARMMGLTERDEFDAAFLWDRIGHWAQYDGDWGEAESAYRKAYELQPDHYGYCLGTALNFLGRHEEALPILLRGAERGAPDAMSWFQVAVARNGVGDTEGSIHAYSEALKLDENYDLAWFNLGGMYWNIQDLERAASTWREAISRFPDHQNVEMVREYMPSLFRRPNDPED